MIITWILSDVNIIKRDKLYTLSEEKNMSDIKQYSGLFIRTHEKKIDQFQTKRRYFLYHL